MNERFVGVLPFEIKGKIKKMIYSETVICIAEHTDRCHVFEVNEFYNIINHQEFVIFDNEKVQHHQLQSVHILDALIQNDHIYVLS